MSDNNIIQFPLRRAGSSEIERTIIDQATRSGLHTKQTNDLLERLRPLIGLLAEPLNISIPIPDGSTETEHALELLLQRLQELSFEIIAERVKRELELMDSD